MLCVVKQWKNWASKPSHMSQKIFENDLVTIRKSKVTLKLNKPAYAEMCILDLSKILMCEFHYDYIKNKYGNKSRLLFTDTDSSNMKLKTKMFMKILVRKDKEMFDFSNYSVVGKMKDEPGGVGIEEFVELKPKMYSFLVNDSSEQKKQRV